MDLITPGGTMHKKGRTIPDPAFYDSLSRISGGSDTPITQAQHSGIG